jgi:hypothetical protein
MHNFKEGQEIVVLEAYAGGSNANAIFVRDCRQEEHKGKCVVQLRGSIEMIVEPERIVDSKVYYKR